MAVIRPEQPSAPEPTEALRAQQQNTALDLASLVGSAGLGGFRDSLMAMRPGGAMSDAQLTQRNVRDQNGEAVEAQRPDGSVIRTYATGARMELDNRGRMTSMTLPGPYAPHVSLEYEGNSTNPSAVHLNYNSKEGRLTFRADANTRIEANPQLGYISLTSPDMSAALRVTGQSHRTLQDGGVQSTFYNHGDRSNTVTHTDLAGNTLSTVVNRADGSGHSIYGNDLIESRFAAGTNVSYSDMGGNQHNFNGIRSMNYSTNAGGGNDIHLTTNDGRQFHLSNVWGAQNGPYFVGQVQEVFSKKWK